jgi:DNA-binding response OmpR family regulator
MHILLIEDHKTVAANIKKFLEMHQYIVTVALDGTEGFEKAMIMDADLLILDINLPGMNGYDICSQLRQNGKKMPILMLTARSKQQEIVHGFDLGADDYLAKPFDLEVLLAHARALLRRRGTDTSPVLKAGKIMLDTNRQEVWKGKKKINLSPKEFALLEYLMFNKNIVQSRPRILEHVWGSSDELMFSNSVDVYIAFLRRKLGEGIIQTVPGKGYIISSE